MLIFQPAEEGLKNYADGGASVMLEEGIFDVMPEAVFGIHVGFSPGGQFSLRPGPLMAGANRYEITVKGKQTHGARPWDGVDPITVSAQIIMGLQTIVSRQVDVTLAPSIISVGRINGGIRNNVIPDKVELEGTIRSFDPDMRDYIFEAMERTVTSIAEAGGAEAELRIVDGPPPLINNAELTAMMIPSLEKASGHPVVITQPQTVAEDFAEFASVAPSVFVFLGNWPEDQDRNKLPTNHSPFFHMHEPYMERGVKAFSYMVVDFLNAQK